MHRRVGECPTTPTYESHLHNCAIANHRKETTENWSWPKTFAACNAWRGDFSHEEEHCGVNTCISGKEEHVRGDIHVVSSLRASVYTRVPFMEHVGALFDRTVSLGRLSWKKCVVETLLKSTGEGTAQYYQKNKEFSSSSSENCDYSCNIVPTNTMMSQLFGFLLFCVNCTRSSKHAHPTRRGVGGNTCALQ